MENKYLEISDPEKKPKEEEKLSISGKKCFLS